ncbi:phage tail protein, partial [Delftia tsuruhatensis]|uniref:phage tail tube protein n=1 Tax=Delftia tsuruhatensis TaxID=180282 RepID=UPI0024473ED5
VFRVADPTTGAFDIEGLNTSNLDRFPDGGGAGTARKITSWTQLPKIPTFEMTGGDPKSLTTSYIDYQKDFEVFTGTNPERLNFTISYQPGTAAYDALIAANDSGVLQVLRMVLTDGSTLFYPGQLFFNKAPVTTKDQEMVNNVSLALQGEITRYAKLP